MTDNLKQQYKDAVIAHKKKNWDEAREKYLAILDLSSDQKLTERINQYLELVEAQKRIPGRVGYYAFATAIIGTSSFSVLDFVPAYYLPVLDAIVFFAFIVVPILATISLFQAGIGNKFIGIFSVAIFFIYSALTWHPESTTRAKVSEGLIAAADARIAVAEFYEENNRFPTSYREAGLNEPTQNYNYVDKVELGREGIITVTYKFPRIEGQTLVFSPTITNEVIIWSCSGGSLVTQYRPASCK